MTITLSAQGLLSKWGFSDGDVLFDAMYDLADEGFDAKADEHAVLTDLVRRLLLPLIEAAGFTVELEEIVTIHNPIRVSTVNGVEVQQYDPSFTVPGFDEIHVAVTDDELRATIRRLADPVPSEEQP